MHPEYRLWKWSVPTSTGKHYSIELYLGLLGKESVSINGQEVASKYSFKFKNSHEFLLPDGRKATIEIAANKNLLPISKLVISNEIIPLLEGGPKNPIIENEPISDPTIGDLSKEQQRQIFVLEVADLYRIPLLGFFGYWIHNHSSRVSLIEILLWIALGLVVLGKFKSINGSITSSKQNGRPLTTQLLIDRYLRLESENKPAVRNETMNPKARGFEAWSLPAVMIVLSSIIFILTIVPNKVRTINEQAFFGGLCIIFAIFPAYIISKHIRLARANGVTLTESMYQAHRARLVKRQIAFTQKRTLSQRVASALICLAILVTNAIGFLQFQGCSKSPALCHQLSFMGILFTALVWTLLLTELFKIFEDQTMKLAQKG